MLNSVDQLIQNDRQEPQDMMPQHLRNREYQWSSWNGTSVPPFLTVKTWEHIRVVVLVAEPPFLTVKTWEHICVVVLVGVGKPTTDGTLRMRLWIAMAAGIWETGEIRYLGHFNINAMYQNVQ